MSQISAELESSTVVRLSNGRHDWTADEPIEAGGTDAGPNPYELLLGSLAACTCLTISMYCRHKAMTLHSIRASYEFSNVHADDCKDCDDSEKGYIERITSNIDIRGDFDDAQRKRLAQIVERCPVHKTLGRGIRFEDNTNFT